MNGDRAMVGLYGASRAVELGGLERFMREHQAELTRTCQRVLDFAGERAARLKAELAARALSGQELVDRLNWWLRRARRNPSQRALLHAAGYFMPIEDRQWMPDMDADELAEAAVHLHHKYRVVEFKRDRKLLARMEAPDAELYDRLMLATDASARLKRVRALDEARASRLQQSQGISSRVSGNAHFVLVELLRSVGRDIERDLKAGADGGPAGGGPAAPPVSVQRGADAREAAERCQGQVEAGLRAQEQRFREELEGVRRALATKAEQIERVTAAIPMLADALTPVGDLGPPLEVVMKDREFFDMMDRLALLLNKW